jgi:hypothetical protein
MKLDLVSPMVGDNYHSFTTRFESRGDHGCKEQWHAGHMRVYIGLGLHEDKNPTSYVRRCIMIHWIETPSTGRVYKEDLGRLLLYLIGTLSICLIYKIYL